jgi:hypothetical protein
MKAFLQSVAFSLLAVGAVVGIVGALFAPWEVKGLFALAGTGCVIGMGEIFGC